MNANETKDGIQQHAHHVWTATGRRGTIAAGTGAGKSRIAVMECDKLYDVLIGMEEFTYPQILLVTPTEKLRDENWPDEFKKWSNHSEYKMDLKMICFASLKNERGNHYDLVILDEVHRLTDLSAAAFEGATDDLTKFFSDNLADAVMGLTATLPTDESKIRLLAQIAPVVYTYTLDQGIEDGIIADYEIRVIMHQLDNNNKVIPAGTKKKPFMTTEFKQYIYKDTALKKLYMIAGELHKKPLTTVKALEQIQTRIKLATFERNRFLYTLPSKTALAKRCIKHMTNGKRTLVLGGGIDQIESLLPGKTFHSKSDDTAYKKFNTRELDILGAVQALDEGLNLVDLDQLLIISFDSSNRRMVQRIGRSLRQRDEHKGMVYILCTENTQEDKWLEKGLEGFDPMKITYYSAKNVPL